MAPAIGLVDRPGEGHARLGMMENERAGTPFAT